MSNPDEDLYSLFLDLYRTSDFGFSALKEDDLQKVFAGKSQKQKQDTEKKLSSLPDVVTIYRGEGSESTPYEKSFSWTTSYKAACFFACRIPSLENSRIITAHINKSDIIEYFPDDEEKEVLVPPVALTHSHPLRSGILALCNKRWLEAFLRNRVEFTAMLELTFDLLNYRLSPLVQQFQ